MSKKATNKKYDNYFGSIIFNRTLGHMCVHFHSNIKINPGDKLLLEGIQFNQQGALKSSQSYFKVPIMKAVNLKKYNTEEEMKKGKHV
tara:strand:+ start:40 stop:303 length:264 start_codon:yes stop_codon:yes gene_type:complete